ncbi:MAG: type II toxin-antitoxin system HipA family toxin [Isosphaeraceae bacterium]
MPSCLVCLEDTKGRFEYHPDCLESLFGTRQLPLLDLELAKLYSIAAKMAGKMSISGAQEKVSLALSSDKSKLEIAASGGRYILKPETSRFSSVPANEHVTMRLANLVSIELPAFGLMRLKDGFIGYLIKRFDRLDDGTKLQVEDFCQLSETPARDKYEGSTELCVRILRKFATEPRVEVYKLFRLVLFSWWTANGDMHLKNFSLLTTSEGIRRLSPAYDLVCTRLVLPDDDKLALPLGGRNKNISRRAWLNFAKYCGLPDAAAKHLLADQVAALEPSIRLMANSLLTQESKEHYEVILRENTAALAR